MGMDEQIGILKSEVDTLKRRLDKLQRISDYVDRLPVRAVNGGGSGGASLNDADGVMNSVASNTSNYAGSVDAAARADHTHAFYYEEVDTLPAIPTTKGGAIVIYDGQMWSASEGDTRWYPMVKFDSESGAPPA